MAGSFNIREIIKQYEFSGALLDARPIGNGHINDTFLLIFDAENKRDQKMVLQRINTNVFHQPEQLMENMVGVTNWLKQKVILAGGDPYREVLNIIATKSGVPYTVDGQGNYWRVCRFVESGICYDTVENPRLFYEGALAFGRFQQMLEEYPAETLHETIEGFHDTAARYEHFLNAVEQDIAGRVALVQDEINFIKSRSDLATAYQEENDRETIPLRVTHNDTKLNNVMLDADTGKGLCVLDLDTVMPGYVMNDFGDAIRYGANTAAEDETDASKISCNIELFEAFAKGFLEVCGSSLTEQEIRLLPLGAKVMTYELMVRFLTDYLEGDIYFKTKYPEHNLNRTRSQIYLLLDMEQKWSQMENTIRRIRHEDY